jgi:hypothetical protein
MFDFSIFDVHFAVGAIGACAVSKRACWNRLNNWPLEYCLYTAQSMNDECPILMKRAQHRPTLSACRCSVVVAADACRRRPLPSQHCLRRTTAWQCRLAGCAQMLKMVESIWCARVVPTNERSRHQCVAEQPSCTSTFTAMYCCSSLLFGGTSADVGQCRLVEARAAVSTIDVAASARWCRLRVRQRCLRCTSTRCRHSAGRAQMSHKVDSTRRVVQCRPSTSPPVHGSTAFV